MRSGVREYTVKRHNMFVSTRRTFLKATAAALRSVAFAQTQYYDRPLGDNSICSVVRRERDRAHGGWRGDGRRRPRAKCGRSVTSRGCAANSGPVKTLFNTPGSGTNGFNEKLGTAGATIIARRTRALAAAKRHVALERSEIQEARQGRPTQQDFYARALSIPESATATSPTPRTRTAICLSSSRSRTSSGGRRRLRTSWPVSIGGPEAGSAALSRTATHSDVANKDRRSYGGGPVLSLADITGRSTCRHIYDRLNQMLNKGRGPSKASRPSRPRNSKPGWATLTNSFGRSFESLWL